mmetsp:Transcript_167502/g.537904  ORF Transcript_167502/g.537904 Transcript_167502/m.537904 type:complete len:88 (-) Transcript_167502:48-311(-)
MGIGPVPSYIVRFSEPATKAHLEVAQFAWILKKTIAYQLFVGSDFIGIYYGRVFFVVLAFWKACVGREVSDVCKPGSRMVGRGVWNT